MIKLDLATAEALIDFSGKGAVSDDLSQLQLKGAVALHNILSDKGLAYLADEVGMGKTYVALGVVALMRRFKPDLRVLYLLPKNNVRDKWLKDYRSFIDKNYRSQDGIVKGFGNVPAAPNRLCRSLSDLVHAVATESARDYFICTSAFSLPMGGTSTELRGTLDRFRAELPQNAPRVDALIETLNRINSTDVDILEFKREVKQSWAAALNGILPQFDLVVVDEAHNYRRGLRSADRNQLLATVLGTDKGSRSTTIKRVDRVLLLSATPFDREIDQLKRQLELFANGEVLEVSPKATWDQIHTALKPFMVRRLNSILLGNKAHTRNMYRTEHRCGDRAEVKLGLEQQLFAALVQKKVSEFLNENNSGKFELGMLASFESYLPSNKGKPVQFDGVDDQVNTVEGRESDAPDRTVVEYLVNDYQNRFRAFPPHPKMDVVAQWAKESALDANKKQLIFVRRVGSVGELKAKIEDCYNRWIAQYVTNDPAVADWFKEYETRIGERQLALLDDELDEDKANLSSFFAWFYRGNNELLSRASAQLQITPFNYRNLLGSASMMFATNWSALPGMPHPDQLDFDSLTELPSLPSSPSRAQQFERAQYAYLRAVMNSQDSNCVCVARRIFSLVYRDVKTEQTVVDVSGIVKALSQSTFWEFVQTLPDLAKLGFRWTSEVFDVLAGTGETAAESLIRKILVHHRLAAAICRLDHPFIDLYALRGSRGKSEDGSADENLIKAFLTLLDAQSKYPDAFSSFTVLRDLFANLDLLLKQNFEDAADKAVAELTTYLTRQLQPLSPVLGATGVNSASRSAIARKFRMPGYPRVLVSTDVFQEGEDLHTFCDSVVHYGISASPISLEQKVGRVDRIASLSHRAMKSVTTGHDDHYIQVAFPHIRESLEFLQVRLSARNLNQFLLSMNKIGDTGPRPTTEVALAELLLDSSPIEPPLVDELKSPFEILPPALNGCSRTIELVEAQSIMNARISHTQSTVERCIEMATGKQVSLRPSGGKLLCEIINGMSVSLRGAHGRDQLIMSITAPYLGAFDERAAQAPDAAGYLRQLQDNPLIRLQWISTSDDSLSRRLSRNAEIFAGAKGILSDEETLDLYHRVSDDVWHAESSESLPNSLSELASSLCGRHGSYQVKQGRSKELIYIFDVEGRTQHVQWRVLDGYVVLTAQILDTDQTAELASYEKLLVQHTLCRNAVFDMVDFHIDSDLALAVRAIHPLIHLNREELEFAASMVAVEADRLRQILFLADRDDDEDDSGYDTAVVSKTISSLKVWAADNNVMCIVRDVLSKGSLTSDELIRQIAYGLGYQRAVLGISTALEGALLAAARRGITIRNGILVQLQAHSIGDYDHEHLKNQFLAAISRETSGFIEREQAVRAFARWMGFARTGPIIADVGASLIRKLIHAGRLQTSGTQIRRNGCIAGS